MKSLLDNGNTALFEDFFTPLYTPRTYNPVINLYALNKEH